jgi:hypothetical protein
MKSLGLRGNGLFINSVADPGSGAFFTPGSGMEKNPDPGSVMKSPHHFSASFDPGFGMEKIRSGIWDKHTKTEMKKTQDKQKLKALKVGQSYF